MARPKMKSRKGQHGDAIGGLPGQPEVITHGSGGGGGGGGPKSVKGPGAGAKISGKTKGMSGK